MIREAIEAALSIGLGLVFVASAVPKLRRPTSFVLTVLQYQMLPRRAARVYAYAVPYAELSLALLLLTGVETRAAATATLLLLLSFAAGVATNVARGRDLDCGCFGSGRRRRVGWPLLGEDVILLGASVAIALLASDRAVQPWSPFRAVAGPWSGLLGLLVCLACAAAAGIWFRRASMRSAQPSVPAMRRLESPTRTWRRL